MRVLLDEIGNLDGLPRVRYVADSIGRLSLLEVKKLLSKRDALGQLILQPDDIYKLFSTYALRGDPAKTHPPKLSRHLSKIDGT